MQELKIYRCEFCGTTYNEKIKCQKCERGHRTPREMRPIKYIPISVDSTGYPMYLEVLMDNGKTVRYEKRRERERMIRGAAGKTNKLPEELAKYMEIGKCIGDGLSDGFMDIRDDALESPYFAIWPEELERIVNTTPTDEKPQEKANTTFREYIEKRFSRRD